jgi:hypothetical protein
LDLVPETDILDNGVMRSRFLAVVWLCLLASWTLGATPLTVDFTAGGFFQYGIGYNTGDPNFDQLLIAPDTGSITLTEGSPQIVTINLFSFGVAINSAYEEMVTGLSSARSLTVNGVTHSITQPFQVQISNLDTLTIFDGPTVRFDLGPVGHVDVTPLGVSLPPQNLGFTNGSLQAKFVYNTPVFDDETPEPGTLALLGLGLGLVGLAGWGRRRMKG